MKFDIGYPSGYVCCIIMFQGIGELITDFYSSIEVPKVQYIDRIVDVTMSVALLFLCES